MDHSTVALVQDSWSKVVPIADSTGKLFYTNLFEADPSLQTLFKGDIDQQAAKLVQMIGAAVGKLSEPEVLVPILEKLGERHVGYGVVRSHYDTVGAALMKTLEQGLGPAFTPDVRGAWADVYGVMVSVISN